METNKSKRMITLTTKSVTSRGISLENNKKASKSITQKVFGKIVSQTSQTTEMNSNRIHSVSPPKSLPE
jgi:hypothetical protein